MGHREDLLQLLHLGPEDLEANRAGRLSPRQARAIAASGVRNLAGSLFFAALLAAILFLVANKPIVPAQWITATVLGGAVLVVGIVDFNRTRHAAADPQVAILTGPARAQMRGRAGWYLVIAGRSFRLPVRPWQMKNDAPYRAYVAAKADRIVALEPDGWD